MDSEHSYHEDLCGRGTLKDTWEVQANPQASYQLLQNSVFWSLGRAVPHFSLEAQCAKQVGCQVLPAFSPTSVMLFYGYQLQSKAF